MIDTIRHESRSNYLERLVHADQKPPLHGVHVMWDIDDVFFPWAQTVHDACYDAGLHNGSSKWDRWEMWEVYGVPKEDWLEVVSALTSTGFYEDAEPIPGTLEQVRRAYWEGAQNHVVTARGFMARGDEIRVWTDAWLEKVAFPWHTRTFSRDKVAAAAAIFNHERLLGQGFPESELPTFDYAIDDGVHNYEALRAAGINAFLLTAPHNRSYAADQRVATVEEFVDMIIEENPS